MSYFLRNEPSQGIGGEPKRSGVSLPCLIPHSRGQTDKREALALRAELPGGVNSVTITEDVREYNAAKAMSKREARKCSMDKGSKEFVAKGSEDYPP